MITESESGPRPQQGPRPNEYFPRSTRGGHAGGLFSAPARPSFITRSLFNYRPPRIMFLPHNTLVTSSGDFGSNCRRAKTVDLIKDVRLIVVDGLIPLARPAFSDEDIGRGILQISTALEKTASFNLRQFITKV